LQNLDLMSTSAHVIEQDAAGTLRSLRLDKVSTLVVETTVYASIMSGVAYTQRAWHDAPTSHQEDRSTREGVMSVVLDVILKTPCPLS
jgi:hypothetical protein